RLFEGGRLRVVNGVPFSKPHAPFFTMPGSTSVRESGGILRRGRSHGLVQAGKRGRRVLRGENKFPGGCVPQVPALPRAAGDGGRREERPRLPAVRAPLSG